MLLEPQTIQDKLIVNKDTKKCFVFDLDGTIIFQGKKLSIANEEILKKIIDHGHEVIFATGRSGFDTDFVLPKWCNGLARTLFNGGLSISRDGEIVRDVHLPISKIIEISDICFRNYYPFTIDSLSHYHNAPLDHEIFKKTTEYQMTRSYEGDLDRLLLNKVYKILILDMSAYNEFGLYAKDNNLVIKHHSYDACFDLVPECCSKYAGIKSLVSDYKNEDVFVFGNDFNDYEMLSAFNNSILFGDIKELQSICKVNILYDEHLCNIFRQIIEIILAV